MAGYEIGTGVVNEKQAKKRGFLRFRAENRLFLRGFVVTRLRRRESPEKTGSRRILAAAQLRADPDVQLFDCAGPTGRLNINQSETPATSSICKEPRMSDPAAEETVQDVQKTGCVIVGGGPAGVMLAFLLARKNVPVTLLESHKDFDRDFRGDTVHPSTLEVLDQLGLADRLLQIPHGQIHDMEVVTKTGSLRLVSLRNLKTRFPYIAVMPQAQFLDFLAGEAKKLPSLRLEFGANVQRLVREDGQVKGIRYRDTDNRLARGAGAADGGGRRTLFQDPQPGRDRARQDGAADGRALVSAPQEADR